jgi:hypothetical protein
MLKDVYLLSIVKYGQVSLSWLFDVVRFSPVSDAQLAWIKSFEALPFSIPKNDIYIYNFIYIYINDDD